MSEDAAPHPLLQFKGVHKAFGSVPVLDGVSLDVPRGQTTVVLGPSGSGKSVLLKHAVGLLQPDAGEVHYDGLRVDTLREHQWGRVRRKIGFVFQMAALFDSMTVLENLAFPLREHTDLTSRQRKEKVHAALERVDLAGVEGKVPGELSGGQRKRVGLARAIMLEPELVLYDEPTTGLDPVRAAGIDGLINRLRADLGVTSLVVTHDLTSAQRVADRVVLLHGGVVHAVGTMDQLRSHEDPIVRRFLNAGDAKAATLGAYAGDEDAHEGSTT